MFVLDADKNQLAVREKEPVTSGSVNVYRVRFRFSPDWDGLTRTAVFMSGCSPWHVPLDAAGECDVPWEALAEPGCYLMAGVYGKRGEDLILPTVWANLGLVLEGVILGQRAKPPPVSPPDGTAYRFGHGFKVEGDTVSVDAVSDFDGDNTLPMTAAGVQRTVGNIEILLETI